VPEHTSVTRELSSIPLNELIDLRYEKDQQRKVLAAQEKSIKDEIIDIDAALVSYHLDNPEVDRLAGTLAKVTFTQERVFTVTKENKAQLMEWMIENDLTFMTVWHLNNAAAREYETVHGEIPHAQPYVKNKVSMRKA